MSRTTPVERRRARFWAVAWLPYPHLMGCAPLDVWLRLLCRPPAHIALRFWPRLLCALCTSALSTLLTLPERILFALWWRWWRPAADQMPAPVFILGYYRSGTTHLQYLLDCDPQLYSPHWMQTLAPQGFVLSWSLLRLLFIPFMPATRPVDALAFGPDVPSEDDFALCNWTLASTLPGRAVVPRVHWFYDRFHDLCGLTPAEYARWCRYQRAFVRKLTLVSHGHRLLLKTPSHTARLEALLQLFPEAKFIHITRHPHAVIRSNMTMAEILQQRYYLQNPLPADETQQHLAREYLATEERYIEMRHRVPRGQLAEVRFQDLLADPISEVRRIYAELGLPITGAFEQRLLGYLDATKGYSGNVHAGWTEAQAQRLTPLLASMVQEFGHDRAAIPTAQPPPPQGPRPRPLRTVIIAVVTAAACAAVWLAVADVTRDRHDSFVWPTGIVIGYAVHRAVRRGNTSLGVWSALLTACVYAGVAFSNSRTLQHAGHAVVPALDIWTTTVRQLTKPAHLFWAFMGVVTAYRLAARRWP